MQNENHERIPKCYNSTTTIEDIIDDDLYNDHLGYHVVGMIYLMYHNHHINNNNVLKSKQPTY